MAWLDKEVKNRMIWMLNLPKSVPLLWKLAWEPRIHWSKKLLYVGGALAYFLLPTDLLPDFFPALGQMDDLTVLLFLMERFIASTPEYIINQHLRK